MNRMPGWTRRDLVFATARGRGSRSICYPALIREGGKWLLFCNGNDMGVDGFGLTEADCVVACGAKVTAHAVR